MHLILTPEQSAQVAPHLRPGWTLLAKIEREPMGVSSLMNDIELACLLLPRGKG